MGSSPSVIMTIVVRNEEDILDSCLEYHLSKGVDYIYANNHLSHDGTRDILRKYEKYGVLDYRYQSDPAQRQGEIVTQMTHEATERFRPDWFIHCDADEFFVLRDEPDYKSYLNRVESQVDALLIDRIDFVPIERPYERSAPFEMVYQKKESFNLKGRPLPPKVMHRSMPGAEISHGNHSVAVKGKNLVSQLSNELLVYHYPIRSLRQFESKSMGGLAWFLNDKIGRETSFHKKYWYQLKQLGELEDEYDRQFFDTTSLKEALSQGKIVLNEKLRYQLEGLRAPSFSHP